nr:MAG TPA: hypothetical protein [Caudoviricetes sp.]
MIKKLLLSLAMCTLPFTAMAEFPPDSNYI